MFLILSELFTYKIEILYLNYQIVKGNYNFPRQFFNSHFFLYLLC